MSHRDGQHFFMALSMMACAVGCAGKLVVDDGPETEAPRGASATGGGVWDAVTVEAGGGGTSSSSATSTTATTSNTSTTGDVLCSPAPSLPKPGRRWAGSPESCPALSPTDYACDLPIDQMCIFVPDDSTNRLVGCACVYDASVAAKRWHCNDVVSGRDAVCPELAPTTGESCVGARSVECDYPFGTRCNCPDAADPSWSCEQDEREVLADAPAGVDPATLVSDLDAAQRTSICEWLDTLWFGGVGYPDEPAEVGPDGYTVGNGCLYGADIGYTSLLPHVGKAQCESNLALSGCEASVAELTECILALHWWDDVYGASCGHYLEQGCSGTTVLGNCQPPGGEPPSCSIKVE